MQSIHSHTFDNSLVLVAEPMMSVESAAFALLIPAGCSLEPCDRNGLAAFTCELSMRGAGSRDSRRFIEDLENLGVERGESVADAHTSFTGATMAANLPAALAIYADLARAARLPDDQLEPVRQTVLQELRAIDDEPSQKVMIELRKRHYPEPWGRSSHGELAALESITLPEIREFYSRNYQPNGAILAVAGRIDWPTLRDHAGRLFADWRPVEKPGLVYGRRGKQHDHVQHETNQTQIGIAFPSVPYSAPDYFQAWGAVGVLSSGMSSRLFTEVRERRGLCYSIYATLHSLRSQAAVLCYAGTSAERAQETLDVTLAELTRLSKGIEAHELQRLKARIKSSLIMQQESSSARSAAIARDWYHLGRVRTLDEVSRIVDNLSRESINEYLSNNPPHDFTVVTLGASPLELPQTATNGATVHSPQSTEH